MKNLTVGKLVLYIIIFLTYLNFIIYSLMYDIPYHTPFSEANMWTTFTGISMPLISFVIIALLMYFIIENWNTKIFK